MVIAKLPESTAKRLKSAVLLLSPDAVVKELVDNALDAEATSIDVQISANTLDKVQVRDNGTGIGSEDYNCLGLFSHTSKLRCFEELHDRACRTLGFRGDALACVMDIGDTTIITRTTTDTVANKLVFFPKPRVRPIPKPIPAPVGTTVVVACLFDCMPVRRKEYVTKASQSINSIKRQLQAYALARPCVKITFKVIGTSRKSDWSYHPPRLLSARDAVMQALGRDLVSNCISKTASYHSHVYEEPDGIAGSPARSIIRALMPKSGADLKAVTGHGAFISVNSRPQSPMQGTMKKLFDVFKKNFRRHMGFTRHVPKPFLHLDISITPGSYDVNSTSAKDEVIFSDEQKILSLFDRMCQEVYSGMMTQTELASRVIKSNTCLGPITTSEDTPEQNILGGSSPPKPAQCLDPTVSRNDIAERHRLQHALDDTLPASSCYSFSDTTLQPSGQDDEASTQPRESTEARLVGGKLEITRTRTTSRVDESINYLPISSWSECLNSPFTGVSTVSTRGQATPWTFAGSAVEKSSAAAAPRTTTRPPPTPQSPRTKAHGKVRPFSWEFQPEIHRQSGSVLSTPACNYSPVVLQNTGGHNTGLAGEWSAGLTEPPPLRHHQRHGTVSTSNGSQTEDFRVRELPFAPCLDQVVLSPCGIQDAASSYNSQALTGDPGSPAEELSWISHLISGPVVAYRAKNRDQHSMPSPEDRFPATPMTLHRHIGGVGVGSGHKSLATNVHIETGSGAVVSDESHFAVKDSGGHLLRGTLKKYRPTESFNDRSVQRNVCLERIGTVNPHPGTSRTMTKDDVAKLRLSKRRRITSLVTPKTLERPKLSRLLLETIDEPTVGTEAVITHMNIDTLAHNINIVASYDDYIITGCLSYTLCGQMQLRGNMERRIQGFTPKWWADDAAQPETRRHVSVFSGTAAQS